MSTIFSHTLQCEKLEMAFHISYVHTWRVDILVLICLYDFFRTKSKRKSLMINSSPLPRSGNNANKHHRSTLKRSTMTMKKNYDNDGRNSKWWRYQALDEGRQKLNAHSCINLEKLTIECHHAVLPSKGFFVFP